MGMVVREWGREREKGADESAQRETRTALTDRLPPFPVHLHDPAVTLRGAHNPRGPSGKQMKYRTRTETIKGVLHIHTFLRVNGQKSSM